VSPFARKISIRWQPEGISNIDFTEWVGGHNEYKKQAVHFLVK
jgi:hypothetical protein